MILIVGDVKRFFFNDYVLLCNMYIVLYYNSTCVTCYMVYIAHREGVVTSSVSEPAAASPPAVLVNKQRAALVTTAGTPRAATPSQPSPAP